MIPSTPETPWTLNDGRVIRLITPEQLRTLPEFTELIAIDGSSAILGRDKIDGDTRGGFLAYGLLKSTPTPEAADAGRRS